jgi:tetratricopeptide (TPR) repeat protein
MDDLQAWLDLAVEQHQAGDLPLAEPLYRKILHANPGHLDAMYLLGTLLLQKGDAAAAIELLELLLQAREDVADVHNNLGIAYNSLGRWEDAARAFHRALKVRPGYEQACFNLASLLEQRELFEQAEHYYRQAVELNPHDPQTIFNLAHVLKAQRRWDDAEDCYVKLLSLRPGDIEALINLGFVLVKQERLQAAIDTYQQVLAQDPNYAEVHNNLSYIFERQGQLEDAVERALRALRIKPDYPEGFNNLGSALRSQRRLEEACDAYQRAIALRPKFALAEFNLGTTRLLAGNFPDGWPGYEQRALTLEAPPRQFATPRWDGQPLPGGNLLIYADQGFGDAVQFVRYLPQVKQTSGARVVFECQPELRRLFTGLPGIDELVVEGEPLPACEAHCALLSLPALFGTTVETIPAAASYLRADPELGRAWGEKLRAVESARLKVGIVWQGNTEQARDVLRSCRAAEFAPLAAVPGVALISLQNGASAIRQLSGLPSGMQVLELGSQFVDFADAAAAMSHLDLIITVDTAAAHLAGALGKPVWTLLAYTADWRWLLGRNDSPWYPSMRLFRQRVWGEWDGVFEEVAARLRELASAAPLPS